MGIANKLNTGRKQTVKEGIDTKDLEYMSAASMLRAMGARVRTVAIYDGVGENGRVIYSSPRANTPLERGQTVTLFVKRTRVNKPVSVPDLVGKPMNDACAEILEAGLLLGTVEYAYSSDGEGTVIFQSVPEGIYVVHGTRIDITVGLGASDAQSESREDETQMEEQIHRHPFKFFGFG
jgi:beta-lactam-binding protein with PASTA domain